MGQRGTRGNANAMSCAKRQVYRDDCHPTDELRKKHKDYSEAAKVQNCSSNATLASHSLTQLTHSPNLYNMSFLSRHAHLEHY